MNFTNSTAALFIPDNTAVDKAFQRITHLGIGAHQDDLEIMAFHGIKECFHQSHRWFGGVTCTCGGNSPRTAHYQSLSNSKMTEVRKKEQEKAALIGEYGFMAQLGFSSADARKPDNSFLIKDLHEILSLSTPSVLYTHNPADKHETHVAISVAVITALRQLPPDLRPQAVYGCEVWRNLDWLPDDKKILLDVSGADNLAAALIGVHDSQINGGKRYDLATFGRRHSNATFFNASQTDTSDQLSYAMDLLPLVQTDSMDITDYVSNYIDNFKNEIIATLKNASGGSPRALRGLSEGSPRAKGRLPLEPR
ncbi:MAG: PIG-L family deacetylase [bacterium]|nr:PIG-L family deacetylase [bacterium]